MSITDFLFKGVIWQRLPHIYEFFFSPLKSDMDHVIIAWGGVLFALCWFLLVIRVFSHPKRTLQKIRSDAAYACSLLSAAVVSAASVGSMLLLSRPDGNYYMLMYALTFLHLAVEMRELSWRVVENGCKKLIPLVLCGAMLCLMTSWSWTLGFTPIQLKNAGFYNHAEKNRIAYEQIGVDGIAQKLADEGGKSRIVIFSHEGPWLLSLPAIAESWIDTSFWGNRDLAQTSDSLYGYYSAAGLDYLLIEKSYLELEGHRPIAEELQALVQAGHFQTEMDEGNYVLLRFHASAVTADEALCAYFAQVCAPSQQ